MIELIADAFIFLIIVVAPLILISEQKDITRYFNEMD